MCSEILSKATPHIVGRNASADEEQGVNPLFDEPSRGVPGTCEGSCFKLILKITRKMAHTDPEDIMRSVTRPHAEVATRQKS